MIHKAKMITNNLTNLCLLLLSFGSSSWKFEAMATIVPTIADVEQLNEYLSPFVERGDKIVVFLDYDGTLAPIASHPNLTAMEPESERSLKFLVQHPNVYLGIISGRSAENARDKVGIDNITYAGNHGLEIIYWNKKRYLHQLSAELKANLEKLVTDLEENLANNGAWIENKKQSLTFHYRQVPDHLQETYQQTATKMIESYGLLANQAHCAIEAKPPVDWNKGEAALLILREEFGEDWHKKVKVFFAGDDTTDEDAMRALKGKGMSFRVSTNPDIETHADFRLPSTRAVSMLLQWFEDNIL